MNHEIRSVPVVWENAAYSTNKIIRRIQSWTPYRIGERPDHKVRVAPYFTTPVEDFTQKEFTLPLPNQEGSVLLTRIAPDQYEVGGAGTLRIFDTKCTYTSNDGNIVFTASIPSKDRTDAICTGLTIVGASMRNVGFSH